MDVFFAISGFLIGSLVFDQVSTGTFSLLDFYGRRIRRILPALILVGFATYAAGWFILFPDEFRQLGKHLAAASLFISNFALLGESGYFDSAVQTKPLLHLWSLAIEEQFYLFWPLYVQFLLQRRRAFVPLSLVLWLASLALNLTIFSNTEAFYLPFSRFWEILSGALLAYLLRSPKHSAFDRWRHHFSWLGLLLLLAALFTTPEKQFPGWRALPPVLGCCLIIYAGPAAWLNRHILARRELVFIGLISYPLYLWHWPLISYAWILNGSAQHEAVFGVGPSAVTMLILLVCSGILATLTHFFVEKPIRAHYGRSIKAFASAGLLLILGGIGAYTFVEHGINDRTVARANSSIAEDLKIPLDTRTADGSCDRYFGVKVASDWVCLANSPKPAVMFVGDSQAMAFHSAIYRNRIKLPAVLIATNSYNYEHAGCLKQEDFADWLKGDEPCQLVVKNAMRILAAIPEIKTVVVHYQDDNPFYVSRSKIEQMQQAFLKNGREVIYVLGEPGFWRPVTSCHPRQITIAGVDLSPSGGGLCRQERATLVENQVAQRRYVSELSGGNPNVHMYDPLRGICDEKYCYQGGPDGAWFWTLEHVNEKGSVRMLEDFLSWARNHVRAFPAPS